MEAGNIIEVKAPGTVKLAGEHSVVAGGPSLSAAVEVYAQARLEINGKEGFEIVLVDYPTPSVTLRPQDLKDLYAKFNARDKNQELKGAPINEFKAKHKELDEKILPFAIIAGKVAHDFNFDIYGIKITIQSEIKQKSGLASSCACEAAFAVALLKQVMSAKEIIIDDDKAIEIIKDAERVQHSNEGAGRVDVGPAFYGSIVHLEKRDGKDVYVRVDAGTKLHLVLFDVGPKPETKQMVDRVTNFRFDASTRDEAKAIIDAINECVESEVTAYTRGNLKALGEYITKNHQLLNKLGGEPADEFSKQWHLHGVSSDKLNEAVDICIKNGALGAKLSGGGGGGIGISLVQDSITAEKVITALKAAGVGAYQKDISVTGARDFLRNTDKPEPRIGV